MPVVRGVVLSKVVLVTKCILVMESDLCFDAKNNFTGGFLFVPYP